MIILIIYNYYFSYYLKNNIYLIIIYNIYIMINNFFNIIGGASSISFELPKKTDKIIDFINNVDNDLNMIQKYILNCKINGNHFLNQIKWHMLILNSNRDLDLKIEILKFLRINVIDTLFNYEDTNIFNPSVKIRLEINQYVYFCMNLETKIDSEELKIDETISVLKELSNYDSFDEITLKNAHNYLLTLYLFCK